MQRGKIKGKVKVETDQEIQALEGQLRSLSENAKNIQNSVTEEDFANIQSKAQKMLNTFDSAGYKMAAYEMEIAKRAEKEAREYSENAVTAAISKLHGIIIQAKNEEELIRRRAQASYDAIPSRLPEANKIQRRPNPQTQPTPTNQEKSDHYTPLKNPNLEEANPIQRKPQAENPYGKKIPVQKEASRIQPKDQQSAADYENLPPLSQQTGSSKFEDYKDLPSTQPDSAQPVARRTDQLMNRDGTEQLMNREAIKEDLRKNRPAAEDNSEYSGLPTQSTQSTQANDYSGLKPTPEGTQFATPVSRPKQEPTKVQPTPEQAKLLEKIKKRQQEHTPSPQEKVDTSSQYSGLPANQVAKPVEEPRLVLGGQRTARTRLFEPAPTTQQTGTDSKQKKEGEKVEQSNTPRKNSQ